MTPKCPKIVPKLSKNGVKMVPKRSALTHQLSARSPNKRCQELRDSCALKASNRQATPQTHTRTHHTHPPHTYGAADTTQQTQHSTHSTAQPQMMSTARWGTAPNGGGRCSPLGGGQSARPRLPGRERVGSLGSVRSSILLFALLLVALHLSAEF